MTGLFMPSLRIEGSLAKARLKVKKGDTLFLTETPDGGFRLTPYSPDFERQMTLAEDIMHDDREVLRQLAK